MRRKYIEDFSELERMLVMDTNFLQKIRHAGVTAKIRISTQHFYESASYEDVITNVLSFGGDADTIGAVAGGIAGAYYGVPESAQTTVVKLNTDAAFWEAYEILERRREGVLDKLPVT